MPIARRNRCRATDVWSCAVITGVGVVSPLGIGSQAHWSALISGHSAVARVDRLPQLGFPVDVGAEVSGQAVAACLPRLPKKQVKLYHHRVDLGKAMKQWLGGVNRPATMSAEGRSPVWNTAVSGMAVGAGAKSSRPT